MKKVKNSMLHAFLLTSLAKTASLFKVSCIIGAPFAFFSLSSMVLPLSGATGGILGGILACALSMAIRMLYHFNYATLLVYHLPGFCASLALTDRLRIVTHFLIPALCMIFFLAHPNGAGAFCYTMFWLIPMTIAATGQKNFFLRSLAATFIAHAVGSVCWLYLRPMPAQVWLSMMPLVCIERFTLALGMTGAYYLYTKALLFISSIMSKERTKIVVSTGSR